MKPELKFAENIFDFVDDLTTSATVPEDDFTYVYVPKLYEFKTITELRLLALASEHSFRAQQVQTPNSVVLASTLGLDPSTGSRPRRERDIFLVEKLQRTGKTSVSPTTPDVSTPKTPSK